MSALVWWLAVLLPLVAAHGLARATLRGAPSRERALATLAGAPIVVLAVVLPLGAAGHLTPLPSLALAGMMAVAAWWSGRGRGPESQPAGNFSWRADPVVTTGIAVAAGFATVLLGRQIRGGTAFSFDDLTYHAAVVAHWVREGVFSLTPFNYHAHYPFNAETLSLWYVLPASGDGWAGLAGLTWLAVAALAAATVSNRLGASEGASTAVAALTVATQAVVDQARTFAAVDLAASASTMAALAVFLGDGRSLTLARCGWVGALAGYAAGCKPSFVLFPVIFAVAAAVLADAPRRGPGRAAMVALGATATGSFWYLRNLWLVGNPLFPAAVGPFDGPLGRAEQMRTSLAWWINSGDLGIDGWISLVRFHLGWPVSFAALAGAGFLGALLAGRVWTPSTRLGSLRLVLATGIVALVAYPFMPFTGSSNAPDPPFRMDLRFLLLPFLVGLILSGPLERLQRWKHMWWACAVLAAATAWRGDGIDVGFALLGTAACVVWTSRRRSHPVGWKLGISIALGVALLAAAIPLVQRATDRRLFGHGGETHPVGRGWQALEALPEGARVVRFGPQTYQYYPLFGRRYQLEPVRNTGDGRGGIALAEQWARGERPGWWSAPQEVVPDSAELCGNLRAAGAEFVFVSKWPGPHWPAQYAALGDCARAERIFDDGYSAIFRLAP